MGLDGFIYETGNVPDQPDQRWNRVSFTIYHKNSCAEFNVVQIYL